MRIRNLLNAALLIAMLAAVPALAVKYVAVVETEIDMKPAEAVKLERSEVRQITDELRVAAVKALPRGRYSVMTTETVMSQSGAVLEACAEENCVIKLGSKIGADYIVRGKLSKLGTLFTLTVSMFDTEDGFLVGVSNTVRSEKLVDLVEKAAGACDGMFEVLVKEPNAAMATPTTPAKQAPPPVTPAYQPSVTPPVRQTTETPFQQSGVNTYKTVTIGRKTWMAENLNIKMEGSWCYDNKESNCEKYGRLYTWNAAKRICPAGWHLPSRDEWGELARAAGGHWKYGTGGKAGKKLKAKDGWNSKGNGTDDYVFSALPGGDRYTGIYSSAGIEGNWWTATEYGSGYISNNAYVRYMKYNNNNVGEYNTDKRYGFSVRCVKND